MTDQLTEHCLIELAKKYRLPLDGLGLSKVPASKSRHETEFYTLTITTDVHHAHIKWTLSEDAIEAVKAGMKGGHIDWKFFGFIKEKPFKTRSVKTNVELEDAAEIASTTNGQLSLEISQGVPYSALFLVAFENADILMIDAETATMIQRPHAPTAESIIGLKRQLKELLEIQFSNAPAPSCDGQSVSLKELKKEEFITGVKNYAEVKKQLEGIGLEEGKIEEFLVDYEEELRRGLFETH